MLTVPKLLGGLSGIYLIQNKVTKCFYVGGSTCLRNRLRQHKNDLKNNRHKNTRLMLDYLEYGADNFVIKVLFRCSVSELLEREQNMLNLLKRHYPTYHKGNDVSCPARGTTRPDYHEQGKRTLDEWRGKALAVLNEKRQTDPEFANIFVQAGKKSMARLRADPVAEAKRKKNAALAQSRPDVVAKKRERMLERWKNGTAPRAKNPPPNRQRVIYKPTGQIFNSLTEAAEHFKVGVPTVHRWVHGRTDRKGGRVPHKDWSLYETSDL